jgi:hypothetical protein
LRSLEDLVGVQRLECVKVDGSLSGSDEDLVRLARL